MQTSQTTTTNSNSLFQPGRPVYACVCCGKVTRATGQQEG